MFGTITSSMLVAILPEISLLAVILIVFIVELILPEHRRGLLAWLTAAGLLVTMAVTVLWAQPSTEPERVRDEIIAALERAPAPRDVFLKPLDRPVLILLVEDDAVSSALISRYGTLPCTLRVFATIEVPMCPGITTDTPTFGAVRRRSVISASLNPFTANFAAQYAVCEFSGPIDAQNPLTLLVFTMRPSSLFTSSGRNVRTP